LLLLQFFHVTRRFFEKNDRGTALLVFFGSENEKKKPEPDWAFFSEVRTGGYVWTLDFWFFENRRRTG
jgi:hypothetical protein